MTLTSVRLRRRERGWTLDDLAERAGTTKSYLSKVERGLSTPSIAVAMALARALETDLAALFGEVGDGDLVAVDRAAGRRSADASGPADGSTYLSLATGIAGKQMMPFVLFPPSVETPCTFRDHAGDEFVVVVEGEVELHLADRVERLGLGDSAYFRGGVAHSFRSVGDATARVLALIATDETRT